MLLKWLGKCVSYFLRKIPIVKSIIDFRWDDHKKALPKFFVLWILSSLPLIWSILFSDVPSGDTTIWQKLLVRINNTISFSELFVYAAAFLSPVLYIIFEQFRSAELQGALGEKVSETFRSIFSGYAWVFFLALGSLLLTASVYSATRTSVEDYESTFIHMLAPDFAYYVYGFAIICWYLSILDGCGKSYNFIEKNREDERNLSQDFQDRVRQ